MTRRSRAARLLGRRDPAPVVTYSPVVLRVTFAEAMSAGPDAFAWRPWGYELPELDALYEPTGYLPVVELIGAVKP